MRDRAYIANVAALSTASVSTGRTTRMRSSATLRERSNGGATASNRAFAKFRHRKELKV